MKLAAPAEIPSVKLGLESVVDSRLAEFEIEGATIFGKRLDLQMLSTCWWSLGLCVLLTFR
jgi:hypothetical protein